MSKEKHLYIVDPDELQNTISITVARALEKYAEKINPVKKLKDWMTRKEVCEMIGISLVTLDSWTNKGILKVYTIGNQKRYIREEVEFAITNRA